MGLEPTPDQVRETEQQFLNPAWCKNCCKANVHPTPLCPEPRIRALPCIFCMGFHRELDCPGPNERCRPAFEVKRKSFLQRVQAAIPRRTPAGARAGVVSTPPPAVPPGSGAGAGN